MYEQNVEGEIRFLYYSETDAGVGIVVTERKAMRGWSAPTIWARGRKATILRGG
jgi:hypothetical protein